MIDYKTLRISRLSKKMSAIRGYLHFSFAGATEKSQTVVIKVEAKRHYYYYYCLCICTRAISLHSWSYRTGWEKMLTTYGTSHIIIFIPYSYISEHPRIFYIETRVSAVINPLMDTTPTALFPENVKQIGIIVSVCAGRALFRKCVCKN